MPSPLIPWSDRFQPRRRAVASLAAIACLAVASSAVAGPSLEAAALAEASRPKAIAARAGKPGGPNPYLSFLPAGAEPDYAGWSRWLDAQGKAKRAAQPAADPTKLILAGESEPNGTQVSADHVAGFGTSLGEDPAADLSAALAAGSPPTIIGPFAEDNGAIPLANSTGLVSGASVRLSGSIGDGPYGSAGTGSGDFDFLSIAALAAGDQIVIDVDTPLPFCCDLDPFVTIFDAAGAILAFNDDQPMGGTYDSYLVYAVPAAGTYYVAIGAYTAPFPTNRFDSSTGTGFRTEGTYDVTIGVNTLDADYFAIELEPGDVIAGNLLGAAGMRLDLFDPIGALRVGSLTNLNFLLPGPLPSGGVAGFAYVAETAGTWAVRASGLAGSYTLELRAFRPALEAQAVGRPQTLFVDFDGATIDPGIFGASPGTASLSPLSSFLAGWGLTPADESPLIDAILAEIEESLSHDLRVLGANGDYDASLMPGEFDLVLLNSRDHADPFGDPLASRLIIGGTIAELGIGTIGIAESIDPGNFAAAETAVVLLDLLSAVPADANSLNQFPLGGGATKIDLVAAGVGNVAAHEAGHFFANFHTNQFNAVPNLMDQGGNLANTVGVGPDLTYGTGDDVDVDFGDDTYVPNEGLVGTEDTLDAVSFGLSTGILDCPILPSGSCTTAFRASLEIKDKANSKQDLLSFRWLLGSQVDFADLGDPRVDADYSICVYDAGGLVRKATAPAGGLCKGRACWKRTGPTTSPNGFTYKDPELTPSGTSAVTLKSGATLVPKVLWKAKGALLADGSLGLVPPITVEVRGSATSHCFGHTFPAGDVTINTPEQLKAKSG